MTMTLRAAGPGPDGHPVRPADLAALFARAHAAGEAAAAERVPTPMVVEQHRDAFDDASPVVRAWHVPDGVCGFAWITLRPGTSRAAKYAKKYLGARKAYEGGMQIWVSAYGQSMERKEAYANAYAAVLRAEGVTAYAGSRMD